MKLNFTNTKEGHVAEFQATADFNIHMERSKGGTVRIYHRGTSDGEYELLYTSLSDKVFDKDFGMLVYPKHIKVVSSSEVTTATVTLAAATSGSSGSGSGSS